MTISYAGTDPQGEKVSNIAVYQKQ